MITYLLYDTNKFYDSVQEKLITDSFEKLNSADIEILFKNNKAVSSGNYKYITMLNEIYHQAFGE